MMIEELLEIIEKYGASHCSAALKRNPPLTEWIKTSTTELPDDTSIMERIFTVINGNKSICELGNRKIFNTLEKGYRFCSKSCECRRKEQSRKITAHQANVSDEERKRRVQKQEETMMTNHGVKNAMYVQEFRDIVSEKAKIIQNNTETREKAKRTNLQRRGVEYAAQSKDVMDKVRQTNFQKRGTEYTTHLARAAFKEQTGFTHPLQMEKYQNQAKESMLKNHGVKHALQSTVIYQKMIENVKRDWGVDNVGKSEEIQNRMRQTIFYKTGRKFVNQEHITEEAYAILQDEQKFKKLFETKSLREVSSFLGISYDGCRKYCVRHGVVLPKSSYETALAAFLESHCVFKQGDRTLIKPYEIDFLIPDYKLGIEFGGLYFHSEKIRSDPKYHLKKLQMVNEKGYRLLTIFEDEWIEHQDIVKSRILNAIGKSEKGIFARKARILSVKNSEVFDFFDDHHIQGFGQYGFAAYAAYYSDNNMIAAMTFCKARASSKKKYGENSVELLRFATDGRNHPGVASKLLTAFIRDYDPPHMHSYADRRWSEGNLYKSLGFKHTENTEIDYFYVNLNKGLIRENRRKFQKHLIVDMVPDGHLKTEKQIMEELKYTRIWGCGHMVFEWTKP